MYVPPGFGTVTPYCFVAVADMPYGDRHGGVRDAHGNLWWISQRLVEEPYSP